MNSFKRKIYGAAFAAIVAVGLAITAFAPQPAQAATPNLAPTNPTLQVLTFHVSGQYTATTAGVVRFNMPFKAKLLGLGASARASGGTTPTLTVDAKVGGTTMLSAPFAVTAGAYSEGNDHGAGDRRRGLAVTDGLHHHRDVTHVERHHDRDGGHSGLAPFPNSQRSSESGWAGRFPGPFLKAARAGRLQKGSATDDGLPRLPDSRHQPRARRRAENLARAARWRHRPGGDPLLERQAAHQGGRRGRRRRQLARATQYLGSGLLRCSPPIEYPIGQNPPEFFSPERYRLYLKPDGTQEIRFDDGLPAAAVRLSFTVKHALAAGQAPQDTVPIVDREAVCKYAAASLCDQLAALYSNTADSTIQADGVDYKNKASERRRQASTYRKQYFDHLGIDDKSSVPASASATVELKDSVGGPRIFHGRAKRFLH
jgi:hypothetical protein